MTKEERQRKIKEILLMPVKCNKREDKIHRDRKEDIIYTGQKYDRYLDEDMSDLAIGFYEIIYKDFLPSDGILLEKYLRNREFAGDTMNSFNTIANSVPEAGRSRKQRTPKENWPPYLQNYYEKYHCLADFWIVPLEIGRGIRGEFNKARGPVYDYMDRFLKMLCSEVKFDGSEPKREYFSCFSSWKNFIDTHFINGYVNEKLEVSQYSVGREEEIVAEAINKMVQRADDIAKSKYADELWEYFNRHGLLS